MRTPATRRKGRRRAYFARLARDNPKQLNREISKRLDSWSREMSARGSLGTTAPSSKETAFGRADYALADLEAAGHRVMELEGDAAREVLMTEAAKAVARVIDPRLHRLQVNPRQ